MLGIILMSYGSPQSIDEVESYFTHILNGRTPSPEQLNRVVEQFRQLETADPLGPYTEQQAEALQKLLQLTYNQEVKVCAGFKHASPYIEDALLKLASEKVTHLATLPLTPIYSDTGVGVYQEAVRKCLEQNNIQIPVTDIQHWHLHPEYISALARRVSTAVRWLSEDARAKSTVVFATHSKPGTVEKNQDYCGQFFAMAKQIADQLGLEHWRIAYRSARPNQPWLGPDVKEAIREEAAKGQKGVVVCDLLTVAANLEVLHEIGRDCKKLAEELDVELVRSEFLNDSADLIFALATIVQEQLQQIKA